MSDNNITNEQDLWDVLNEPVSTESKKTKSESKPASRPKTGPKFAKPGPVQEPTPAPAGSGRRFDGIFFACMAGVAAVSVAATLVIGGMLGGDKTPAPVEKNPPATTAPAVQTMPSAPSAPSVSSADVSALEQENAELRQQVELQKQQIQDLRAQLLDLGGTAGEGTADSSEPDPQAEAYEIFRQIQQAYDEFDREALEKLIPEMDNRLSYLSAEALSEYYLILEYVEQPSNG